MKTKLEITVPGESDRHYVIDTRAIVGKGASADVSLEEVSDIQEQHFRIKLGPSSFNVRLASGATPLTYEGRPFAGGEIPYGSDFYLNRVRFSCSLPRKEGNQRTLVLAGVAVVAIGAVVAMTFSDKGSRLMTGGGALEPIELFAQPQGCPATDAAAAARKADQLERAAYAKRERYRYDAHDGLDAGRLFAEAAQCYAVAADAEGKARVDAEGAAWRQRLEEEFRAARVQMVKALEEKRTEDALIAVVSMRRMLEGEPHPYADWLRRKELELNRKLDAKKR